MQPMPSRARTFCTLGTLCSLILAACGGGSSNNNTPSVPTTTVVAQLSADQAAFESMVLAPNATYIADFYEESNPLSFFDVSESLPQSPLSYGKQRATIGNATAFSSNSNSARSPAWFVVNGQLVEEAYPYAREYRYQNDAILLDIFDKSYTNATESVAISNVSSVGLTGALADAPAEFKQALSPIYASSTLLKSGAQWADGAAYIKYTVTYTQDFYRVDASTSTPTVVFTGATLSAKLVTGIVDGSTTYTQSNGRLSSVGGIPIYTSNTAQTNTSANIYRAFFEINNKIYSGYLNQAGAKYTIIRYNTPARTSLQAALTF